MPLVIGSGITIGARIAIGNVVPVITVTLQPSSVTAYAGGTATFSTSATATLSAVVTYQWAKLEAQGGSWTNIQGATSSSYTTGTLNVTSDNGDQYRCVISAGRGAVSVNSSTATLYVEQSVITIETQPSNQTVIAGNSATFSVGATVTLNAVLSYQWQYSADSGSSFYNLPGETGSSFTQVYYIGNNGNQVRVQVSATKGAIPITSNSATITVLENNTMLVGNYNGSFNVYYGASTGAVFSPAFGALASDYINAAFDDLGISENFTKVYLTYGSYSGFNVGNFGEIDGDLPSYPRVFYFNNTGYTFFYDSVYGIYVRSGYLQLNLNFNSVIPVYVDIASTPTVPSNSILISSYTGYSITSFGASTGINSDNQYYGPVYGTVKSDYFLEVSSTTSNGSTYISKIRMKNGTYTGFAVSSGAIGTDTTGSTRVFTIDNVDYTFTVTGSSPAYEYEYSGLITGINNQVGNTYSAIYDPAKNGGGGGGGGSTYTAGVDYGVAPPGISFEQIGPSTYVYLSTTSWTNQSGSTALLALASGGTFTVSTLAPGGGSTITSTITLTSSWSQVGSTLYRVTYNSSPTVSTDPAGGENIPFSVTLGGGGGGGGTSIANIQLVTYFENFSNTTLLRTHFLDQNASDAAYTLLNAPGSWSVVGNYLDINFNGTYGNYTFAVNGPSTQFSGGPSYGPYYIHTPGTASGTIPSAPQQPPVQFGGGPFTMTQSGGGGGGASYQFTSGYADPSPAPYTLFEFIFDTSTTRDAFATALNAATKPVTMTVTLTAGGSFTITVPSSGYATGTYNPPGSNIYGIYIYSTGGTIANTYPYGQGNYPSGGSVSLGGGGGGGGVSMSNISYIVYNNTPINTADFLFATQGDRDTAYNLINGPGSWSITGNFIPTGGGPTGYGTFTLQVTGPSNTSDFGPPSYPYVLTTPGNITNENTQGPAQPNGPFSAVKQ